MKSHMKDSSFAVFAIFSFFIYVMSNGEWSIPLFAWIYPILFLCMIYFGNTRRVYFVILSIYAIGFVFIYGAVMLHFAGDLDKSVRIAGVTVPVSDLLNHDQDIYSTFYTDTFTDENITNTRDKLESVADELFIKTRQEA